MNAPAMPSPAWWAALPALDEAACGWRNALLRRDATPFTDEHGERYSWRWQAAAAQAGAWMALRADARHAWLRVDQCHGFAGCPAHGWWALAGWARQLAWAVEYAPLVDGLRAALGLDVEPLVDAAGPMLAPADDDWLAGFSVEHHGRVVARGVLAWPARQSWPDLPAVPPVLDGMDDLPMPFSIELDSQMLSAAELSALGPGAVLLLPGRELATREHAVLCLGEQRLALRLDGGRLVIGHAISHLQQETPMFHDTVSDDPALAGVSPLAPLIDTAQLPVRLSVELAGLDLPLSELAGLQPGLVIDLGRPLDQAELLVRANGRPVARGELVRLGDWLGVRITDKA
ncbi:FliM/FliN family flagellar motor switch protein [Chitinivorax sp. PXF-14]|uniref:FliM/FliN family flagellar motor switch protein n=1 Tax=Chitinivorax sp. PXF-14 TaxID=3230488 RepID=UPI003465A50D